MTDLTLTLRGRVATDLATNRTPKGNTLIRFRLAVPQWRIDDHGNYQETGTQWYTIKAWNQLGDNLISSLRKGQRVIVVGRPNAEAWVDKAGEVKSSLSITASTVGHDLTRGTSRYMSNSERDDDHAHDRRADPDTVQGEHTGGASEPISTYDGQSDTPDGEQSWSQDAQSNVGNTEGPNGLDTPAGDGAAMSEVDATIPAGAATVDTKPAHTSAMGGGVFADQYPTAM